MAARGLSAALILAATLAAPAVGGEPGGAPPSIYQVTARRLFLKTSRVLTVAARVDRQAALVDVHLDRPVSAALGVERVAFRLHLHDAAGRVLGTAPAEINPGDQDLQIRVPLPGPGRFQISVAEEDVEVGPARIQIHPGGRIVLVVEVPAPRVWIARGDVAPEAASPGNSAP